MPHDIRYRLNKPVSFRPNSDGRLRTLVEEAGAYLGCKIRLFSYYRSPVFSSLLLFTLSTFRDRRQASDVQLESIAFQELSCIFPRLVEWLPLSPSSANSHVESHGTYVSHSLPTPATSSASSLPLHSPVSGSAYNQPSSMNIPHSSPQHPAAAPHWSAAHATPGSALALSMTNTVSDLQQTVPQEAHRTPNDAYLPQGMNNYGNQNGYSLPFQAMESLSKLFEQQGEADRLDTSRLFDSATWSVTPSYSASARVYADFLHGLGNKPMYYPLSDTYILRGQVTHRHQTSFLVLRACSILGIMAMVASSVG